MTTLNFCEAKQNHSDSTEGFTLRVKFVLLENSNAYKHRIHITTILFASAQPTALEFSGRRLEKRMRTGGKQARILKLLGL